MFKAASLDAIAVGIGALIAFVAVEARSSRRFLPLSLF